MCIDAIALKYRTGSPWVDLAEHSGSWKGAHSRLRKRVADGTWEKVFTALLAQADSEGDLDWVVAVDSTMIRAHQHAVDATFVRHGSAALVPVPMGARDRVGPCERWPGSPVSCRVLVPAVARKQRREIIRR
ncbi:hypothetical protein O1L60_42965 [Streptomyces diastatochromogenes]|nr:hypothetical protein [Streptomyces diastatochromogenes]